jgi:hypothetical protein
MRLDRELRELNDDYFDTWIITVEQDQEQDQDTGDQDTRPQKRRYSSEAALDSTDLTERRYPLRKRQLTRKAAALILEL